MIINGNELSTLLRYEPNTGKLFWLPRTLDMFEDGKHTAQRKCNAWNSQFANKEAFTAISRRGYRCGMIYRQHYRAHRVIWALATGVWPKEQIDHIDHDRQNNCWDNLREATNQENQQNQTRRKDNISGICGVGWHKQTQKWQANIRINGRLNHLGLFLDKNDAGVARKVAETKHGFHKNHGM